MKNLFKYTLPVVALCALAACSDDLTSDTTSSSQDQEIANGREMIAFSPEGDGMTRAGTPQGFTDTTKVVVRIKAQNGTATGTTDYRYTNAIMGASEKVTSDDCNSWGLVGEHSHVSYNPANTQTRYWDDAFGRKSKLTVYAVAVPNKTDAISNNILLTHAAAADSIVVNATTNSDWYTLREGVEENTKISWTLSTTQTTATMENEDLTYSNNIRDGVTGDEMKGRYHQTWGPSTWTKSMQLGRLEWQSKDPSDENVTIGMFDKGHMVFQHALTQLVFNLTEGEGFDNKANTDFVWTNKPSGSNVSFKLVDFPISGKLDLSKALNATGMWTDKTNGTITQLPETFVHESVDGGTTSGKKVFTLKGYVLPGTQLDENNANLVQFEIDNAKYYVSGEQIAEAIKNLDATKTAESAYTLAGKRYFINLTVSKKKIDNITAAVLEWEDVTANNVENKNTYCTFDFEDRNTKYVGGDAPKFNIYRAEKTVPSGYVVGDTELNHDWEYGYTTDDKASKSWETNHWSTGWYWKDNKTYYHFRAAGYTENTTANTTPAITLKTDTGAEPDEDYFEIAAGAIGGATYKDYIWGAPFTYVDNSYKIKYAEATGFAKKKDGTYQISGAIGATESVIKMLLFHATCQITVNLTTTKTDNKVVLKDGENGSTVKIVNFLPSGKVLMGNGAVSASGTRRGELMTRDDTSSGYAAEGENPAKWNNFTYGMVPQALSWSTPAEGTIGLEITTPDGNKYYVRDLSTKTGSVTTKNLIVPYSGTTGNYVIDKWYPHYQYTYNITLTKKGIDNITAAVLDWEDVTGNNIPVDLEK